MVQMAKSTKDFELFLRRNPGAIRVSTENSKDAVILARCAVFGHATAEFRIKVFGFFDTDAVSGICGY